MGVHLIILKMLSGICPNDLLPKKLEKKILYLEKRRN